MRSGPGSSRCGRVAELVGPVGTMPTPDNPDDDQAQPIASEVPTSVDDPVMRSPEHREQSITPIATGPPKPIKKQRT